MDTTWIAPIVGLVVGALAGYGLGWWHRGRRVRVLLSHTDRIIGRWLSLYDEVRPQLTEVIDG